MTRTLCRPASANTASVAGATVETGEQATPTRSSVTNRDVLGAALAFACARGSTPVVELLLAASADPDYRREHDDYAMTPLVGLVFENEMHPEHVAIANLLLAHGASRDHVARSHTALGYAEDYERTDMIEVLREAGAVRTEM